MKKIILGKVLHMEDLATTDQGDYDDSLSSESSDLEERERENIAEQWRERGRKTAA